MKDVIIKVVETFGKYIEQLSDKNPGKARWLLKTGWEVQNLKYHLMPDRRLLPADQYLAHLMMDTMLKPLKHPEESVIVSVFTPCELMQEAGLSPYNVESFSCYLSASMAERGCLQQAENTGQKHYAVIIRHFWELLRRGFFRNRNVSCIQI